MSRIKELDEQRAELHAKMKAYHESHSESWSDEDEQVWNRMNADYNALLDAIQTERKRIEAQAERARLLDQAARVRIPDADRVHRAEPQDRFAAAFAAAIADHGEGGEIAAVGGKRLDSRNSLLPFTLPVLNMAPERRWHAAMGTTSGPLGGYTVPTTFVGELEAALLSFGPMLRVSRIMQTPSGEEIVVHMVDDTANQASLVAENTDVGTATDITFAPLRLGAHALTSGILRVSRTLLEDTSLTSFSSFVSNMLGERLSRAMNKLLTNGTGGTSPLGITKAATLGKTTAAATAITFDELIDLRHSVDPAYRSSPTTGWMLHDQVLAYVRKLKDSNNRYLWTESNVVGDPDRLMGYPIYTNNDMQSTLSTGKTTVLFGDFSKYIVRVVGQMQVTQLTERYAEYQQVGFVVGLRFDGALLDAGTHPVKYLKQA